MKVLFTKFRLVFILLSSILFVVPAYTQTIRVTIANGCLDGYTLGYDDPATYNGKNSYVSTNTKNIVFGGVTYPNQSIFVFWAATGDNIDIGGSSPANNVWVAVIVGGNSGVLYHPTATGNSPPPTGWVAHATQSCTNAPSTVMSGVDVLPVELINFNAQATEGSKNHLTWTTASELNNKYFDIERSTDGTTFHNIGQMKGNNKPSSYQFVDNKPFGTSYYRLRQIDNDGTETLSKVVSVERRDAINRVSTKVYPTLVSNGTLTVDTEGGQLRDFSVTNLLGQQVLVGKTTQQIDVSALAKGTYVLKVGSDVAKFVKQ